MSGDARVHAAPAHTVRIPCQGGYLDADVQLARGPHRAMVLFAHGSGSSRHSTRNQHVARQLHAAGFGTVLPDLLTAAEQARDGVSEEYRFDIPLLGTRMNDAVTWIVQAGLVDARLGLGLYGASTGAAAALHAAATQPDVIGAVVCRGGRVDLAAIDLPQVSAAVLMIVGEQDPFVLDACSRAQEQLPASARVIVVPGASHLFTEPGALEDVSAHTVAWYQQHL